MRTFEELEAPPPRPAPLLTVAGAFALGVGLGLAAPPLGMAVWIAAVVAALLWIFARGASFRHAVFYALVALVGLSHAQLALLPGAEDVRRLDFSVQQDPNVQWQARIADAPRVYGSPRFPQSRVAEFWCALEAAQLPGSEKWQPVTGTIILRLRPAPPTAETWEPGDRVRWCGRLTVPQPPSLPGQFNKQRFLSRSGVYFESAAQVESVERLSNIQAAAPTHSWLDWRAWQRGSLAARDWAVRQLGMDLQDDPTAVGILSAMVVGYRSEIPAPVIDAFKRSDTYHLFAVSGQNVGVLLGVGLLGLYAVGISRWKWGWTLIPAIAAYCLVCGLPESAVRASVMGILVLLAWRIGRPVHALNFWALALLAILAVDPRALLDIGFQLTFAVVLTLIIFTPLFLQLLRAPWHEPWRVEPPGAPPAPWTQSLLRHSWRVLAFLLASSAAAWIGAAPLIFWHFHQLHLVGWIANLAAVPLASGIVVLGGLALAAAAIFVPLGAPIVVMLLNNANWLLVRTLLALVTFCAQLPGAQLAVADVAAERRPAQPEAIVFQAGPIPSILIRHRAHAWLVNPGPAKEFARVTAPLLDYYGINALDGVIVTEWSKAAVEGIPMLLTQRRVARIAGPQAEPRSVFVRDLLQQLESNGRPVERWHAGLVELLAPAEDAAHASDALIAEVLWPDPSAPGPSRRASESGLVLCLRLAGDASGKQSLLFLGGVSGYFEQEFRHRHPQLQAEVLVQGWPTQGRNLGMPWRTHLAPRHLVRPEPSALAWGQHADWEKGLPPGDPICWWPLSYREGVTVRWEPQGLTVESGRGEAVRELPAPAEFSLAPSSVLRIVTAHRPGTGG